MQVAMPKRTRPFHSAESPWLRTTAAAVSVKPLWEGCNNNVGSIGGFSESKNITPQVIMKTNWQCES